MTKPSQISAITDGRGSRIPESNVGERQQGTTSHPTSEARDRWQRTTHSPRAGAIIVAGALVALATLPSRPARAFDAKKIFNSRCTACHTYGKGVKVGPDLKGVTVRRQRPWLVSFVRASSKVIASGDRTATDLFRTFKKQRMPDWSDLSPEDVGAIMDWLAVDGPDQKPADERDAETASAADLTRARALFEGKTQFASGGLACSACHTVRDHDKRSGGTLGPELTNTYLKYRDRALTLYLRHPCTPRQPELSSGRYLEPDEAFAIKAYMREVALAASPFSTYPITEAKRGRP